MRFTSPRFARVKTAATIVGVVGLAFVLTMAIWFTDGRRDFGAKDYIEGRYAGASFNLFTRNYPADRKFDDELIQLRGQGKLKTEDEILIHRSVLAAAKRLNMPPSLLWCLFFQESRLNRLLGIEGDRQAHGLGQFEYFSFYEINHHIDRYGPDNLEMLTTLLGKDVRPVEPKKNEPNHESSYYAIPTAVTSSAAYLNNRYLQLKGILDAQQIPYDPQILWMFAAMAYNKGTRAVLSLWNEERALGGKARVSRLVSDKETAFKVFSDPKLVTKSLKRVWPNLEATNYSQELIIHMENIRSCATNVNEPKGGPVKQSGSKKQKIVQQPATEVRKPDLRLVKTENPVPDSSMKAIAFFFVFAAVVFSTIIYFSTNSRTQLAFPEALFQNLPEIYAKQGLEKFLENKALLKDWVTDALRHPERDAQWKFAHQLAVYLFPESLSGDDFERGVALEQWKPLELAIEKDAKNPESRIRFEDIRANIWNYENPDREHPQLTTYATQVIRIYDVLSSP